MSKSVIFLVLSVVALVAGCQHARSVVAADARDYGDSVRTRFRYRLVYLGDDEFMYKAKKLHAYQPDVFDEGGIPVTVAVEDTLEEASGDWTMFFPMFVTFGILPSAQTTHVHRRGTLFVPGTRIASVEICANRGESMSFPLPLPLPALVFSGDGSTCFASSRQFALHSFDPGSYPIFLAECERAMAYGIASRLKEAEDSGRIDERFAATARSAQSLSDAAAMRSKVVAEDKVRRGVVALSGTPAGAVQPFEIMACDNDGGKDFAYRFALRRRGGGAATLSDYGVMRTAFRSAIRAHYASVHPDVNPRTLVVDFTEYALKGGLVTGRVAVLSISAESLSYDAARRKGVIRVRIGAGQFEDARRWIRRNLASVAARSNVAVVGDAVPAGARFYSQGEEMREGVLEVSFRTE